MSGFFGMLRLDGAEIAPQLLERVAGLLRFRGPDGESIWQPPEANVATCFAFLSTGPARQAAQQPVKEGDNWVIGDVRLDERRELIDRLKLAGALAAPDSAQEELLLRAWKTWGESALQEIIGDFSFALWDHNRRSLWCARDFVGPRPFYYAHTQGMFCFSNTLGALRAVPEISSRLDEIFIGEFLLRGYCSDLSRTPFVEIHRLPAGHLLKYYEQSVQISRFRTLPIEEPHRFSETEEYLEAYRAVLRAAVDDRLPEQGSALYLSGGLDSGSVSAIACELAKRRQGIDKLKAFTVGWRPFFPDPEPRFAALSAAHLCLTHEILEARRFEPFAKPGEVADRTPELTCDATFSVAQEHYRRIAGHSSVALSGDGGDDVLTGQSWPYLVHMWNSGHRMEIVRILGSYLLTHGALPPLRAGIKARLRRLGGRVDEWADYPEWLNPEFEKHCGLRERWHSKPPTMDPHPWHPDAYKGLHSGYWSTIQESEEAGNTRVALEARAPLLDLRVLRFLLRVPPVPLCINKEIVRRSMRGYLPQAVLNRPKTVLAGDPVQALLLSGQWTPRLPDRPDHRAQRFLDWDKWKSALKYSKDCTSGPYLFPLALVEWLKDVENGRGIQ